MNQVVLHGRLGSDPEISYTSGGTALAKFLFATTEKYKEQTKTLWHRIVAWGKMADVAGKYLKKGGEIIITGKISYNEWVKDGIKRKDTDIVMLSMEFCGSPKAAKPAEPEEDIPF